ncbi:hypothetical protein OBBRIDRAFT_795905 [Obba rivulosa]|uniref:Uncharacterized protein n=1 Tax=Obba rivulosa TaxID=1052685 RepID=A0A8E2ANH6_9APHY|nr:hypothetical protein OBBRIDRAFT_795905 [Obba rivulosa]
MTQESVRGRYTGSTVRRTSTTYHDYCTTRVNRLHVRRTAEQYLPVEYKTSGNCTRHSCCRHLCCHFNHSYNNHRFSAAHQQYASRSNSAHCLLRVLCNSPAHLDSRSGPDHWFPAPLPAGPFIGLDCCSSNGCGSSISPIVCDGISFCCQKFEKMPHYRNVGLGRIDADHGL